MGFLCGYVSVEKSHPLYEKDFLDDEFDFYTDVHGGLTFSKKCDGDVDKGICHLTNDDDSAWWFGFDCAHAWDYSPALETYTERWDGETYRDMHYVTLNVESLAKQLKEMEITEHEKG